MIYIFLAWIIAWNILNIFLQENEKTKDVIIEQRFHRAIIGAKGEKIREIRDKYPEVQISFPDAGKKSDIVNLRGPREDVDSVYTFLKKLNAELVRLKTVKTCQICTHQQVWTAALSIYIPFILKIQGGSKLHELPWKDKKKTQKICPTIVLAQLLIGREFFWITVGLLFVVVADRCQFPCWSSNLQAIPQECHW